MSLTNNLTFGLLEIISHSFFLWIKICFGNIFLLLEKHDLVYILISKTEYNFGSVYCSLISKVILTFNHINFYII